MIEKIHLHEAIPFDTTASDWMLEEERPMSPETFGGDLLCGLTIEYKNGPVRSMSFNAYVKGEEMYFYCPSISLDKDNSNYLQLKLYVFNSIDKIQSAKLVSWETVGKKVQAKNQMQY